MGVINKAFIGMDALSGAGKVKKAFNSAGNNKYDQALKMTSADIMRPAAKTVQASNFLDEMYEIEKNASSGSSNKGANSNKNNMWQNATKNLDEKVKNWDTFNERSARRFKRAVKSKDVKNALKFGGRTVAGTTPAILAGAGLAYGTKKAVEHFEKKKPKHKRSDLLPGAAGAGVGSALAFNAITNKSVVHPLRIATKVIKNTAGGIPTRVIKNTGKVGEMATNVYNKSKKGVKDFFDKAEKSKKNQGGTQKTSEEIDMLFALEKQADVTNPNYAKKVFKENFIRAGVESIPYNLAPAIASVAIGRDLKSGGRKLNKEDDSSIQIVDIPTKSIENITKTASLSDNSKRMIERSAEGLGRVVFPTATSLVIGKNIMKNMEDIKKDEKNKLDKLPPVKDGMTRIVIYKNGLEKKAYILDESPDDYRFSEVVEAIKKDVAQDHNHDTNKIKGLKSVRLPEKIRKKQKMVL